MTIMEGLHEDMTSEEIPPPVNNACVPDIYNKLDAGAIERTKVINTQLNVKLRVQERVILKYRSAAESRYIRERDKLRAEMRNINRRLPNYADIPHLETKLKKLRKSKKPKKNLLHDCVFTTEPVDIKGLSAEKDDKPFCDRYITHHLPTKSRHYQDVLTSVKKGMSMPDLRPKPRDHYRRLIPLRTQRFDEDTLAPKLLPAIHSMDDHFIPSKSHVLDDDDDTKTV
ncbi:hypothetical protein ACF0H5_003240 [Mactra antiquata]